MTKHIIRLGVAVLSSINAYSQHSRIDSLLGIVISKEHMPGLAACTIENGKMVWSGYYGFQNIEKKVPVTRNTAFMIASTSKTITAAALMQLHAKGKFQMDDDINKYLDFKVFNPKHPGLPITFRQLLRHRSSIADNSGYLSQFWDVNNGDPTISLSSFLKNYLTVKGKEFDSTKNFYAFPPGAYEAYSNIGFALIGYLVERISGQPFDRYCKQAIFDPLNMDRTAWFLRDLDTSQVAMPYQYSDSLKQFIPFGFGGYPDYPAGQLRTTAEGLANFLIAWMQNGNWKGKRVFDSSSVQFMTPDNFNLGFYTWFLFGTDNGRILYHHAGADNGVSTYMLYNPFNKKGLIVLVNGAIKGNVMRKLVNLLYNSSP